MLLGNGYMTWWHGAPRPGGSSSPNEDPTITDVDPTKGGPLHPDLVMVVASFQLLHAAR